MHRRAFLSLMMENLLQFWPPCMGSRRFQKVRGTCILDGYHTWAPVEMETCIQHDDETFEKDLFSFGTWHHDGFRKSLTWGSITIGQGSYYQSRFWTTRLSGGRFWGSLRKRNLSVEGACTPHREWSNSCSSKYFWGWKNKDFITDGEVLFGILGNETSSPT